MQALFGIQLLFPRWPAWMALIGIYFLTLFISIPRVFYSINSLRALSQVPVLMLAMVRALLQMKKKRAEFIHTPKSFTEGGVDG